VKQFVLVFDRPKGEIVEMLEFPDSERDRALRCLFERENRHRGQPQIEVVMLGADSIEVLKRTHMRYFKGEIEKRIATLG
jgi:hypothetical protein